MRNDEAGPANLVTLLQTTPESWAPRLGELKKRIGDWEKEPNFLKARSPVSKADQIRAPLLVVQGGRIRASNRHRQMRTCRQSRKNGKLVQYLLFPDDGHDLARPENEMKCRAAEEAFLAKHLGGRLRLNKHFLLGVLRVLGDPGYLELSPQSASTLQRFDALTRRREF